MRTVDAMASPQWTTRESNPPSDRSFRFTIASHQRKPGALGLVVPEGGPLLRFGGPGKANELATSAPASLHRARRLSQRPECCASYGQPHQSRGSEPNREAVTSQRDEKELYQTLRTKSTPATLASQPPAAATPASLVPRLGTASQPPASRLSYGRYRDLVRPIEAPAVHFLVEGFVPP